MRKPRRDGGPARRAPKQNPANAVGAISRRTFLAVSLSATGALLVAAYVGRNGMRGRGAAGTQVDARPPAPNLFVRIEPDGTTVIGARVPEIGQGVKPSRPMLIAEELDADWSRVRVEQLPLGLEPSSEEPGVTWKYGPQGAGGSTSIPEAWADHRQVGAKARWLLVQAAAARWQIEATRITTRPGSVVHPDGRTLGYGELAADAATLTPPDDVPLKDPKDYRIVGTPVRVVDAEEIVTGKARYGIDATLAGALVAVIARCPSFDGALPGFEPTAAKRS